MLGEVWVTIVIILQCADTFKSNNLKERRRRKREDRELAMAMASAER